MHTLAQRLVEHRAFEYFIITIILISAVLIGLETSEEITAEYGGLLEWGNRLVLGIFILEAAVKIYAVAPRLRLYFTNGWNLFDFTIILLALLPATGEFAMVARLARSLG